MITDDTPSDLAVTVLGIECLPVNPYMPFEALKPPVARAITTGGTHEKGVVGLSDNNHATLVCRANWRDLFGQIAQGTSQDNIVGRVGRRNR